MTPHKLFQIPCARKIAKAEAVVLVIAVALATGVALTTKAIVQIAGAEVTKQ